MKKTTPSYYYILKGDSRLKNKLRTSKIQTSKNYLAIIPEKTLDGNKINKIIKKSITSHKPDTKDTKLTPPINLDYYKKRKNGKSRK